ncbi:polysaccharide deacetylase family protein [Paenibacillus sp. 481]|uniref:polysaccharide deacetylase family protein n=1 Tax=Paenibacillus sp. 481 TaxID=2835869 RepID=UPI001E2FE338|nr:polysaccharide deacetylase family protein [Paenibacillus sp. 481]UHA71895.1 polysaccharide deacetylase family protein [Paenibacillus sp. 481]
MMKYRFRRAIATMFAGLLVFLLFAGCMESSGVSVELNGAKIADTAGVEMAKDGQLMVSSSFATTVLGVKLETAEAASVPASILSSSPAPSPSYYSDQVAILMYHHLADKPEHDHILSVHDFEQHMKLFKEEGFNVLTMDEYVNYMTKGSPIPDNAVLLTFDDGYESFYTHAFPILRIYGYTATNFIIVSAIDNQTGIPKLTWDQMREMKAAGMSFYNHTYESHLYRPVTSGGATRPMLTHPLFVKDLDRRETKEEYKARIWKDLSTAERRLKEELNNTQGIIAFPFGAYNDHVIETVKSLGMELSFTVTPGMNGPKDKVAFRFDAGNQKQSPKQLISLLKGESGGIVKLAGKDVYVKIAGKRAYFMKQQPIVKNEELWLPLRELSAMSGLQLQWNNASKKLKITTARK